MDALEQIPAKDYVAAFEVQDTITYLQREGCKEFFKLLSLGDKIYKRNGKLNKLAIRRMLNWSQEKMEQVLVKLQDVLEGHL